MSEYKETVDYESVINTALTDIYFSRAKITWTKLKPDLEEQIHRYLSAITSLTNLITPIIEYKPDLNKPEELIKNNKYREAVKHLDNTVIEIITKLNEKGLLLKTEKGVRIGIVHTD